MAYGSGESKNGKGVVRERVGGRGVATKAASVREKEVLSSRATHVGCSDEGHAGEGG